MARLIDAGVHLFEHRQRLWCMNILKGSVIAPGNMPFSTKVIFKSEKNDVRTNTILEKEKRMQISVGTVARYLQSTKLYVCFSIIPADLAYQLFLAAPFVSLNSIL